MKKSCKSLLKIVKWSFIIVIAVVILFLIVRLIGQRINSKTPKGGINEQMYVDINGTKQWISIHGQNKDNPVLLWLQAGPGEPTSMVNYVYTRKWQDKFDYNQIGAIIFNPYYSLADYVKLCSMDISAIDRYDGKYNRNALSLDGKTEYQVPFFCLERRKIAYYYRFNLERIQYDKSSIRKTLSLL